MGAGRGRRRSGGRAPRVIAGSAGGLRLTVPAGREIRPTADRVKESLFAALGPGRLVGAVVLDLYAGTGALAIEALSRGAGTAVLVERDQAAVDAIRRNLASTGLAEGARVVRRGVATFLRDGPPREAPFDLVLCDPPYAQPPGELGRALEALGTGGWLGEDAGIVIERAAANGPPTLPPGWVFTWQRAHGDTLVTLAVKADDSGSETDSRD